MKVLIIDDEKVSRKVLLRQMEGIGDCTVVDDSEKGLKLVLKSLQEKQAYDLITMDVSMPKMDGPTLLKMIRKKEQSLKIEKTDWIKIIMVTSRMNISTIKKCIKLGCNGYLSKPVNKYQLLNNLAQLGVVDLPKTAAEKREGKAGIVAGIIKRFYAGKIQLPVLPGIVTEVQSLMKKSDPSIESLGKIIQKDILISTKLISIANSSLYRGVEKVEDLNTALVRLGAKAASGLVSSLVAKDMFASDDDKTNELFEQLWMHSFACACIAKHLAEQLKHPNPETLFLMGIVHDIGKMLLIKAIADINPEETFEDDIQIAVHEIHTTFGAVLLKKMRFAPEFISVAEFHHWNDFSKKDDKELVMINLADNMARELGYGFFDLESKKQADQARDDTAPVEINIKNLKAAAHLGIEEKDLKAAAEKMAGVIKSSAKAF